MTKIFASMKFGLALFALITISAIVATFTPNTTIYSSIWFRGLVLLLCLNLTVCTFKKLPLLFKQLFSKPKRFLNSMENGEEPDLPIAEKGILEVQDYLKKNRFTVALETCGEKVFISARKNLLTLAAPHVIHISILVIVTGGIIGNFGTAENIKCFVGETIPLPNDVYSEAQFQLKDFQTLYDKNNSTENWQSDFIITSKGQEPVQGSTKVNNPFEFRGIKFYQYGYGYIHHLQINMGGKERSISFNHDQPISLMNDTYMVFTNKGRDFVLNSFEEGELKKSFILEPGKEVTPFKGLNMIYSEVEPYSIIRVKKDPGVPLVMLGFLLMSLGFSLSWFGKYQEVSILADKTRQAAKVNVLVKGNWQKDELQNKIISLLGGND
ncbi:MAG: cytochrome c biogenesis protein ResB [Bacillota bacterium]